ncbi:MAG: ECF-type sigma factor [Desulfobacterales bacterium]|nr:ECF-type sigma factor [Desulfobacterales bacterium]
MRRIAAREMRREKPGRTLQTTALVHEAYLRLLKDASLSFENRARFLGIAARAMREILIEHARARSARKRGGGAVRLTLDDLVAPVAVAVGRRPRARRGAASGWPGSTTRHARVVELRYFGGLSVEETAAALELSPATVKRAWTLARAWLFRELKGRTRAGARAWPAMTDEPRALVARARRCSTRRGSVRRPERAAFLDEACAGDGGAEGRGGGAARARMRSADGVPRRRRPRRRVAAARRHGRRRCRRARWWDPTASSARSDAAGWAWSTWPRIPGSPGSSR